MNIARILIKPPNFFSRCIKQRLWGKVMNDISIYKGYIFLDGKRKIARTFQ